VQSPIFRQKALERLSSPEQLDQLMQVTDPRGWLAAAGIGLLIAAAAGWACLGTLPLREGGAGLLMRTGGMHQVVALHSGVVTALEVQAGQAVRKGEALGRVMTEAGEERPIVSPDAGEVAEVVARVGSIVSPGALLARLDRAAEPVVATVYVPVASGEAVKPGMAVELSPAGTRREVYGYVPGSVISVAPRPMTREALVTKLGDARLAESLAGHGPVLEVVVEPAREPANPTGLRWSVSSGPPLPLAAGTPCAATIRTGARRPISLLFPAAR
jgi:multidrug efflux pump subunit AcrA (membrane-fusion protein)